MTVKPRLEFPLEWHGKLIATDAESMHGAIVDVLSDRGYDAPVLRGNASSGGRYVTWTVRVVFETREAMDGLTGALAAIEGMKMVL